MKGSRIGVLLGILIVLAGLLVAIAAVVAPRYVPFDAPSYAAWTGIALAVLSFLSVLKPPRFLGIRSRLRSLVVFVLAVALAVGAVLWPTTITRVEGPQQRLDGFLSEYQFREYHEAVVQAPVERVVEAARQVSFADMPAAVWLMRVRDLAGGRASHGRPSPRPILEMMAQPGTGFLPLDVSDPREIVYGMVGKPWTNEPPPPVRTAEQFLSFAEPGQIRVAFNIRIVDEGGGRVRISTETRTLGNDAEARRVFSRYWRIIYPGSAIIRRVWLDAIAARARAT
jgi:hypothetical protein